jgi:hypothetical protein
VKNRTVHFVRQNCNVVLLCQSNNVGYKRLREDCSSRVVGITIVFSIADLFDSCALLENNQFSIGLD